MFKNGSNIIQYDHLDFLRQDRPIKIEVLQVALHFSA